uniref:Uncharacterized protein n=1 Tax=Oryza barthii TaxID=65489 RepID=A0A0D3HSS4_9ORYZ
MGMDELNKAECISNTSCDVKVIIKIGKPRCFIGVVLLLATNMKWRREGVRASSVIEADLHFILYHEKKFSLLVHNKRRYIIIHKGMNSHIPWLLLPFPLSC